MTKNASLIFGQDGKTAHIAFSNNTESEIYESKSQVLRALPSLIEKEKITPEEAGWIAQAVFLAEKLPNRVEEPGLLSFLLEVNSGGFGIGDIINNVLSMPSPDTIMSTFPEVENEELITKPIFRMCACGKNHAYILLHNSEGEGFVSPQISSKHHGLRLVKEAEENYGLVKAEADRLIKEIDESALPKFNDPKEKKD